MIKGGYVYLLASQRNGTLYIGVTSKLEERLWQHHAWNAKSFTGKYQVNRLVWYEQHATIESAIAREKQLKKWNRAWKIKLVEKENPNWDDLALKFDLL